MSLTLLCWIGVYCLLVILAVGRPSWAAALYLMTFYASPHFWWWGRSLTGTVGDRINLVTALVFATIALFHSSSDVGRFSRDQNTLLAILVLYVLNATVVHSILAANVPRSFNGMTMLWKQVVLLTLMCLSLRDRKDLSILMGAIVVGTLYIAFEVVINGRGRVTGARLEGVGAPGAAESNYLAGLMLLAIPLAGYWLFFGAWRMRLLAFAALVLTFEVILRCNSRGAFLATFAAGGWLLIAARGRARRYALSGVALGLIAAFFMVGDQDIVDRFMSTFASSESRDGSAQSRLDFWSAATRMIIEHPFGSGAEAAFKSNLGAKYIRAFFDGHKAVHQGYLDIAAAWGVQGFVLYLSAILYSFRMIHRKARDARERGDYKTAFLGACIQSTLIGQLVSSLFISSLDGEWFFWTFALAVGYSRLALSPNATTWQVVTVPCVDIKERREPVVLSRRTAWRMV